MDNENCLSDCVLKTLCLHAITEFLNVFEHKTLENFKNVAILRGHGRTQCFDLIGLYGGVARKF